MAEKEYGTWFSRAILKECDSRRAIIEVPNKFVGTWLEERYLPDIKKAFKRVMHQTPEIHFIHAVGNSGTTPVQGPLTNDLSGASYNLNLKPSMTFQKFIIGECNRFAYTSALEVARRPSDYYNPLYIYGDSGCGKTHLLQAIGRVVHENNSTCNILYLSSDSYASECVYSLKNEKMPEFRQKYGDADVLLFDDIQYLGGKKRTQEEFLILFNKLLDEKKQIVISGNGPPNALREMSQHLISRLGWGLLTEIQSPDNDLKVKLIRTKAHEENVRIPDDVMFFLASTVDDIKTLLDNMVRIQAYASFNGDDLNISIARSLIKNRSKKDVDIEDIKSAVANYFNLTTDDLISNKKKRAYSYPRQLAMYLTREYTSLSYKQIGDAFGRKNHSTAIYAIKRITKASEEEGEIRDHLRHIQNLLN